MSCLQEAEFFTLNAFHPHHPAGKLDNVKEVQYNGRVFDKARVILETKLRSDAILSTSA